VPVEELSEPAEGEVFAHVLVGMSLVDAASGKEIGPVVEFYELPQGLLLEFRAGGALASLPFVDEFVLEVDRESRTIRVTLPAGLVE
jgi:ribosomal 30S subunit maturation factor RimM